MYVYISYLYIPLYMCMRIHIYIYIYIYMMDPYYLVTLPYTHIYNYVHMYIYIYICIYIYVSYKAMYIYKYIPTRPSTSLIRSCCCLRWNMIEFWFVPLGFSYILFLLSHFQHSEAYTNSTMITLNERCGGSRLCQDASNHIIFVACNKHFIVFKTSNQHLF